MTIHDETPVLISQDDWEFRWLLYVWATKKPSRMLEIGTYAGGTLYYWLHWAKWKTHVVSVDFYDHYDNRELYNDWSAKGAAWTVIRGNSHHDDIAEQVAEHGPFDFIFIDAGHLDEEVRRDVELYLPMAAEGAIVAFHDVARDAATNLQVWHVWDELRREYRSAEFRTPGATGIGVLFL